MSLKHTINVICASDRRFDCVICDDSPSFDGVTCYIHQGAHLEKGRKQIRHARYRIAQGHEDPETERRYYYPK